MQTRKPVAEVTLRFEARDVPGSARIDVTDIQMQPGEQPTGIVPNPREAGTSVTGRRQYRNGVIHEGMEVVALANLDRTTPAKVMVRDGFGDVRVGGFRFGDLSGEVAEADAQTHSASHGWGRPPIITERSDLYLRTQLQGRAHLRLEWEDREP